MKTFKFLSLVLGALWLAGQFASAEEMLSKDDVAAHLRVRAATEKNTAIKMEDFISQYGDSAAYPAKKVKLYAPSPDIAQKTGFQGFKMLLRKDSSDVLTSEDPRLKDEGSKKKRKFDDVEGATFSFARDYNTNFNTWSVEGALIFPLVWNKSVVLQEGDFYTLRTFGLMPSISVHRVINERTEGADEISQIIPRVGVFGKWIGAGKVEAITLRGFASYARDTEESTQVAAGEFELEPHVFAGKYFRIGYNTVLWPTTDPESDDPDSRLSYQLRLIFHGEVGHFENTGTAPMPPDPEYDFIRLGAQVRLDLDPFFSDRLSLKFTYKYLPAVRGENPNDSLLTADVEWLLTEPKKSPRISLKASYVNGGLDLTKEREHTLLLGLGAAF
jgi:hypothetical protein